MSTFPMLIGSAHQQEISRCMDNSNIGAHTTTRTTTSTDSYLLMDTNRRLHALQGFLTYIYRYRYRTDLYIAHNYEEIGFGKVDSDSSRIRHCVCNYFEAKFTSLHCRIYVHHLADHDTCWTNFGIQVIQLSSRITIKR